MCMRRHAPACLAAAALAVAVGCSRAETPLTPEAARAKGDAMLRQMSQTLASAQTFSYSTDEVRERVRPGGAKIEDRFTRQIVVRRPDALALVQKGQDREGAAWYDGKSLTIVTRSNVGARPDARDARRRPRLLIG
jgi:hypothetical protein